MMNPAERLSLVPNTCTMHARGAFHLLRACAWLDAIATLDRDARGLIGQRMRSMVFAEVRSWSRTLAEQASKAGEAWCIEAQALHGFTDALMAALGRAGWKPEAALACSKGLMCMVERGAWDATLRKWASDNPGHTCWDY